MKFIFANNYCYLRGGSERVFYDEINMLRGFGHEIALFSRHFNKNIHSEYSEYFASDIEYQNVSLIKKISAGAKLIYSYECRKKFDELLKLFNPNIIHAHNIYGRLTTSIIDAAKERQIPVVMTLHDLKLICPSYLMLLNGEICESCKGGKFYHCTVKRCHKGSLLQSLIYTIESYFNSLFGKYDWISYFVCPSNFLMKKHIEAGIPEKKLIYIANFIKTKIFEPNYSGGKYILFVGRLSREKGIMTLLNATKDLKIPVWIVGDGPMRAECEGFVKKNKIVNVVFKGYKSGNELEDLFRNCAFLVFPSQCYENAPMSILEAFAYGKPVIGSNIGGIPEMVIENQTGVLFNSGDHIHLKEKIEQLLNNPSLVIQMGKQARRKVEEEYNEEIHYQKLMSIYKKIL